MQTNPLKNRLSGRLAATFGGAVILLAGVGIAAPANAATLTDTGAESTYVLSVNGQEATLAEGQSTTFQMQPIATPDGQASTDAVYPGDGTGTITVTAANGSFHWEVEMHIPATSFAGSFSITDLNSGFGGGSVPATAFSGDAPTSKLRGHRYVGTLTGQAFFLGAPVSTTGPNNTSYTYNP